MAEPTGFRDLRVGPGRFGNELLPCSVVDVAELLDPGHSQRELMRRLGCAVLLIITMVVSTSCLISSEERFGLERVSSPLIYVTHATTAE